MASTTSSTEKQSDAQPVPNVLPSSLLRRGNYWTVHIVYWSLAGIACAALGGLGGWAIGSLLYVDGSNAVMIAFSVTMIIMACGIAILSSVLCVRQIRKEEDELLGKDEAYWKRLLAAGRFDSVVVVDTHS